VTTDAGKWNPSRRCVVEHSLWARGHPVTALVPIGNTFALSLYDWIDIEALDDPDGSVAAGVVARLHQVSARYSRLSAIREDFAIPHLASLQRAPDDLDHEWCTGPYAEATRTLLVGHAAEVLLALAYYDRLADAIQRSDRPWCLTHGEPKGSNLVQDPTGAPHLVDWDSARIAPAERDLGPLDHPRSVEVYQQLMGGNPADPKILLLYRLWRDLAETAVYVLQFHRPHADDNNMAESWKNLEIYLPTKRRWSDLPQ
jgi:spectinomycin phosphotransferase